MFIGKIASLLATVLISISVSFAVPATPALACDVDMECDDPIIDPPDGGNPDPNPCPTLWQRAFVDTNMWMESCEISYDYARRELSVKTNMVSNSVWGYHGCVSARFIRAGGSTVLTTSEHRWGVDGGDIRQVFWSDDGPAAVWDHIEFVHRRC